MNPKQHTKVQNPQMATALLEVTDVHNHKTPQLEVIDVHKHKWSYPESAGKQLTM